MTNVSVFAAAANSGKDDRQNGKTIDDVNGVTKCVEKYFRRCAPALRRFDLFGRHAAAVQSIGEQKPGQAMPMTAPMRAVVTVMPEAAPTLFLGTVPKMAL